jgi:hypothetical protein
MKPFKLNLRDEIEIGSVVKYRDTNARKTIVGEVCNIVGAGNTQKYEVILYDMRLKPIMRGDGTFKRRNLKSSKCKLIDETFTFDTRRAFELGDVVCVSGHTRNKFGVIVGFTHPDGLFSTSYEHGYNGTDFIDCVEIEKRGLRRKRDFFGKVKRFSTTGNRTKICDVDLWNRSGPKITIKK